MASTNPISTNDWDTVYALYFPKVNQAIVHGKASPKTFTQKTMGDNMIALNGTFTDWQLTTGGAGSLVHMVVPIPSSTLTIYNALPEDAPSGTQPTINTQHEYTGIQVFIEVSLAWVAADLAADQPAAGSSQQLQMAASPVLVLDQTVWGNCTDETQQSLYSAEIQNWFDNNVGAFKHVFSTLNLNQQLKDKTGLQWVMPTGSAGYAVADSTDASGQSDIAKSVFAVLCMTGNRPAPPAAQVSPNAIPVNANAAFLIAPKRVMSDMLLPGLPLLFSGNATINDFTISPDGLTATSNKALTFSQQRLDNGKIITPTVPADNFQLALVGAELKLSISGMSFEYQFGYNVSIDYISSAILTVNTLGQFKLDVIRSSFSTNVSQAGGLVVIDVFATIIAAVVGAVIGCAIEGAAGATEEAVEDTSQEMVRKGISEAAQDNNDLTSPLLESPVDPGPSNGTGNVMSGGPDEATSSNAGASSGDPGASSGDPGASSGDPGASSGDPGASTDDPSAPSGNAGSARPTPFRIFTNVNWRKVFAGALGATLGIAPSVTIALVEKSIEDKHSKIPTLNAFGNQVMAPITWPHQSADEPALVNGSLNGPLQIGLNLTFDDGTPAAR